MRDAEPQVVRHDDGREPFVLAAGIQLQPQRIRQDAAAAIPAFGQPTFDRSLRMCRTIPLGAHGSSWNAVTPA
jgi:hypothetical protein